MLTDYAAPNHQLGQHATDDEVDRDFGRRCTELARHEDVDAQAYTDALGRVHCITVMKRTAPTRAPYTARIRWARGMEERIGVHLLTSGGVIEYAEKAIKEQAEADARETFDMAIDNDHDGHG